MRFDEYRQHDAVGLAELVRRKEVSPAELLALAQARTEAVNPQLAALMRRFDERAQARLAQPFDASLPFAGVPFVTKALFQDIEGQPMDAGSAALAQVPAPATCDVVRRWEAAGLVVMGASKTPEFGARNVTEPVAHGPARNPWDLARTPGGSSGGSAALVAAGVVPMAGANDGGGSIRIPAAACGLFGLKPGRGRVSMGPTMGEAMFGAAQQGVVSRSVRDTAASLDVLQGPEPHAPYWMPPPSQPYTQAMLQSPGRLRIGYTIESPVGEAVEPEAQACVMDAVQLLDSLGHHVEAVPCPVDGPALAHDFLLMWFCEMATIAHLLEARLGIRSTALEPDTQAMVAFGRSVSAVEMLSGLARWNEHNQRLARFFEGHDLWLSPTLSGPPRRIGELDTPRSLQVVTQLAARLGLSGLVRRTPQFDATALKNLAWTPYTQLANLTGRPAMSVPLYWPPEGLPMGAQFVAPLDGETRLLQLAHQLEQARPWFARVPPL